MLRVARRPNKHICYVGPNDDQTKRIAWDLLKTMTRHLWAKTPVEKPARIDLINGTIIRLNGAFKPDNLRGVGIDFLVLDEFASLKPRVWTDVLRAALADRKGRVLFIGTPLGRNHFYHLVQQAKSKPAWQVFQFTTAQGGLVDQEELADAARDLDSEVFQREFEGKFTMPGSHRVYHAFDPAGNVQPVEFAPAYPLIWSLDFNVNPMCMLFLQRIGEDVNVLDELIIQPEATTEAACQLFHKRAQPLYWQLPSLKRPLAVEIYGDASGSHRRTAGATTDWQIVRNFFNAWKHLYRASFHTVNANPLVRDRVNCVNARLLNHLAERRLFIDPRCQELIRDFEQVSWQLNHHGLVTTEINKSDPARTHASGALGYYISQAFNMLPKMGHQPGVLPLC
jgi:hypothetical protein